MSPPPPFAELHARSAFSFLRGTSLPGQLAAAAAAAGLPAFALCDRDVLSGAPQAHAGAREHGLRALVGCELTLADGGVLPVLVETRAGYRHLCRLLTRAKLRAPKGEARVAWEDLAEFAGGLVALTGDWQEGPAARAWRAGGGEALAGLLRRLRETFGAGQVFAELQRHGIRAQARWEGVLTAAAAAHGLPVVAANGPLHAFPEGRPAADAFTCLRHHTTLDAAGPLLAPNAELHLKGPAEMARVFADRPEALAVAAALAERLAFTLGDLGYEFPHFPVPAGENEDTFLRKVTLFGADQRYGGLTPAVRAQLDKELDLIARLGFSGYFLIVWDLVNFARDRGILAQGRGSAANSAVCYALGITAVDPIGCRLLFERFLSEGRTTWPDIDIDFPSGERREEVIQEVYRRYGPRGAAMTANYITYRGRSAAREMAKVLGLPEELVERFNSLFAGGDYPHTLQLAEQMQQAGLAASHPRAPAWLDLYLRVQGLPRHLGQHTGGMIICRGELDAIVPLENASMPGRVVAQWDKEDCADLGIVKVDLLGLGMMACLQDTIELCAQRGRPVDLARLPKDDPATYDLLCAADTVGLFQVESRAQQSTLPRLRPRTFYDLAIEVALIRPGPIQGNLVHPYLNRRQGKEPVTYSDPRLVPILERTLGVPLFQEQMLQIAMVLANFTGTEAEEMRRAMGFTRDRSRLEKVRQRLRERMEANGVGPQAVAEVIEASGSFALYGFPESHSISFALLAYASAWLKVHRPAEFYAGLLNNQPMGFYAPATLLQDARRRGLEAAPVCVRQSDVRTTVEADGRLRLGLHLVRGLRADAAAALVAERARQPFASVEDLVRRAGLRPGERRLLAASGALNALAGHRRAALWAVEGADSPGPLFDLAAAAAAVDGDAPGGTEAPLAPMTLAERVAADFETTGVTTGTHPMAQLRQAAPELWRAADLPLGEDDTAVEVGGAVICRQRPGTAKGVVFISLEDETGIANAIVHPRLFERARVTITQEPYLRIAGQLQISPEGVIHVRARSIRPLVAALPPQASHDFH